MESVRYKRKEPKDRAQSLPKEVKRSTHSKHTSNRKANKEEKKEKMKEKKSKVNP